MNLYLLILGYTALILSFCALIAVLIRLGRSESNKKVWLIIHRISGYLFFTIMTVLFFGMLYKIIGSGGSFGALNAAHITLGLSVFFLMVVKWLVVKPFRGQMKFAPAAGLFLVILTFVTVNLGSTVPILGRIGLPEYAREIILDEPYLFEVKCSRCHTLERIYGRKRNEEETRAMVKYMQALDPKWISDEEAERIIGYLNAE